MMDRLLKEKFSHADLLTLMTILILKPLPRARVRFSENFTEQKPKRSVNYSSEKTFRLQKRLISINSTAPHYCYLIDPND